MTVIEIRPDGYMYINGKLVDIGKLGGIKLDANNTYIQTIPPIDYSVGDKWHNLAVKETATATIVDGMCVWVKDGSVERVDGKNDFINTIDSILTALSAAGIALDTVLADITENGRTTRPVVSDLTLSNITGTTVDVGVRVADGMGYSTTGLRFRVYIKDNVGSWVLKQDDIAIGAVGSIDTVISITGLKISTDYTVKVELYDKNSPSFVPIVKTATVTTGNAYIKTPTVTVSGYPGTISITPTITASAFTPVGASDTHASTTWRIKNSGGTVVWESPNNTTNKTSITVPSGFLQPGTTYTFEAIHTSTVLGNSNVGALIAATANTLNVTIITVNGGSSGYENYQRQFPGPGGEIRRGNININLGSPLAVIVGAGVNIGYTGGSVPGGVSSVEGFYGDVYPGSPNDNGVTLSDVDGEIYSQTGGAASIGRVNRGHGGPGAYSASDAGRVVIKYAGTTPRASGGTITTSGGYTYHTFIASGTFNYTG